MSPLQSPISVEPDEPGRGWSYEQTQWLWRTAEDAGFHAVFHNDHM